MQLKDTVKSVKSIYRTSASIYQKLGFIVGMIILALFALGIIQNLTLSVANVLEVSIDRSGNVTFAPKVNVPLPKYLGAFEVEAFFDAANALNVLNTLTIRIDGVDKIYDLAGHKYREVTLGSGYYRKIHIVIFNDSVLVEVERVAHTLRPQVVNTSQPRVVVQTVMVTNSAANVRCDGLLPRLQVDGMGRVNRYPNENNRLRSSPSLTGNQLGVIRAGHDFRVLDGPVCANGINWWQVRSIDDGLVGWTAEGQDGNYLVEPL